ncbi:MAG: VIT family protein [Candidatus Pacebacteria bacterium]|nr:VIT family protein [Candidatus Paceibacterota bacterium]
MLNTAPESLTKFEPHNNTTSKKLNWLRASVLGANDGIVSTASIIVGVAGASSSDSFILTAGVAGMVAGALSMAAGEYISVSTQRDTERALIEKERQELIDNPAEELQELTHIYKSKGLSMTTAEIVAKELTERDAFAAHLDAELGINPDELTDPWHAAYASGISFVSGAIIPIIMVIVSPVAWRIHLTFFGVFIALVITGALSAYAGEANMKKAIIRVTVGGVLAMIVTFGIGKLFGVVGI